MTGLWFVIRALFEEVRLVKQMKNLPHGPKLQPDEPYRSPARPVVLGVDEPVRSNGGADRGAGCGGHHADTIQKS